MNKARCPQRKANCAILLCHCFIGTNSSRSVKLPLLISLDSAGFKGQIAVTGLKRSRLVLTFSDLREIPLFRSQQERMNCPVKVPSAKSRSIKIISCMVLLCCEKPDWKAIFASLISAGSRLSPAPQLLTLHLAADL